MKITMEQVKRWNEKLSNGFELDIEHCLIWSDKEAKKDIKLPSGNYIRAVISWWEVREGWKTIGVQPRMNLSLWMPGNTPGVWCSHGVGAMVYLTEEVYAKRSWNELAKFTAEWNEEKILAEAEKHYAKMMSGEIVA